MSIVTLTLNPAIDVASEVNGVRVNHKTRTVNERVDPGGGGINAASMIRKLGGEALAVILAGGVTGRYLQELLEEEGLPFRAVPIGGRIRMCTTVHDRATGDEYRFVPEGPVVSQAECAATLKLLDALPWQWLLGSGSLPRGVRPGFYAEIARLAARRGGHFVLDTSGPALKASLGPGVALLKPSLSELEFLVGRPLPSRDDQAGAALSLVQGGATERIALTLGAEGAMFISAAGVLFAPAMQVEVRSSVGAGDGFLGAMVLALSRGAPPEEALSWGVAAGAAVTSTDGPAASADRIRHLFAQERQVIEHPMDVLQAVPAG
jgi:6-phosphofructokinase 2